MRINQILMNIIKYLINNIYNGRIIIECTVNHKEINLIDILIKIKTSNTELENIISKIDDSNDIGLTISKKLIELHNSALFYNNSISGSELFFTLKFQIYENFSKIEIDKLQILLCEDTEFNIKYIKKILSDKCIIDVARNGKIGLEKLVEKDYDIILMDINMPIMNGYSTVFHIRNNLKLNTPIIAISANYNQSEKNKCFEYGMNDFIKKPFSKQDLYDSILRLININKEYDNRNELDIYQKINMDTFKEFSGGDKEFEEEIISLCIYEFKENLKDLNIFISEINYEKIKDIAYKMKSNVLLFGLNSLNNLLSTLEDVCKLNDIIKIKEIYQKIKICVNKNIIELESIILGSS